MLDPRAELVRIGDNGEAHAIGRIASQRLRERAGTFRILPAPNHVVFMRYTGEDGHRDDCDGAIVRLAGEITHPGALCDVIAMVAQAGWRGQLYVLEGAEQRSVFFDQGTVVGVTTSAEPEHLGDVMYRFGAITMPQFDVIMARVRNGSRFGEAAVELGISTREQIYAHLRHQLEEVTFAVLAASDGTFFFLDDIDGSKVFSGPSVSANALLMDAVTRMDEMKYFRSKIPSKKHVPVRVDESDAPSDETRSTYAAIDGKRSVEEIGRITGMGEFGVTKQLYSLVQGKHITIRSPWLGGPAALVETANDGLRVVFATADAAGRRAEVAQSLSSFALGAGVFAILLDGAGPNAEGELDASRIAENSLTIAGGADPDHLIGQLLHDYLGFAVFSAGNLLGKVVEAKLKRDVASMLGLLRSAG
ncbi:MAG TPA: DUF4388 domain-containing protein [Polyangiaceae bacterium]|nr:DUF4388 domain-containing protein [Polyangiaceae bacterium]